MTWMASPRDADAVPSRHVRCTRTRCDALTAPKLVRMLHPKTGAYVALQSQRARCIPRLVRTLHPEAGAHVTPQSCMHVALNLLLYRCGIVGIHDPAVRLNARKPENAEKAAHLFHPAREPATLFASVAATTRTDAKSNEKAYPLHPRTKKPPHPPNMLSWHALFDAVAPRTPHAHGIAPRRCNVLFHLTCSRLFSVHTARTASEASLFLQRPRAK